MPAMAAVPPRSRLRSAGGTTVPTGAKMIAESSGSGDGSKESCAEAAPRSSASVRAAGALVKTCTAAPLAIATWAARCAGPPRRQVTLGQVQVGAADAAAQHPDQQLAGAGLGNGPVGEDQRPAGHRTRLPDCPRAH